MKGPAVPRGDVLYRLQHFNQFSDLRVGPRTINKTWEVVGGDIPNNVQIDEQVVMDDPVAHSNDRSPWDIRVGSGEFRADATSRFPDILY